MDFMKMTLERMAQELSDRISSHMQKAEEAMRKQEQVLVDSAATIFEDDIAESASS